MFPRTTSTNQNEDIAEAPPLGGYKPRRVYVAEGEWVRGDPCEFPPVRSYRMPSRTLMLLKALSISAPDCSQLPSASSASA